MQEYEEDLKSPLKGVMFGNLMQAMLIQMQKLKVHTEAAYLTMDKVIASNNLTMAISAAFTAMGLACISYWTTNYLWTRGSIGRWRGASQHSAGETLRLSMVELERSLLDAY